MDSVAEFENRVCVASTSLRDNQTLEEQIMAQYQAVADAFRVSQRESRLLTELAKRRAEAAKAENGAAPKTSVMAQAGKAIEKK